ncbi:MAG: plasmid replication protein RepB [Colwellia sp.]|nr:plasmid replication protein RepB [Colwellia sp.]
MELNELKNVFDAGGLKSVVVTSSWMGEGFEVIVTDNKNKQHTMSAQRSDGEARVFKSISAAITNATNIGFREVLFKLA